MHTHNDWTIFCSWLHLPYDNLGWGWGGVLLVECYWDECLGCVRWGVGGGGCKKLIDKEQRQQWAYSPVVRWSPTGTSECLNCGGGVCRGCDVGGWLTQNRSSNGHVYLWSGGVLLGGVSGMGWGGWWCKRLIATEQSKQWACLLVVRWSPTGMSVRDGVGRGVM